MSSSRTRLGGAHRRAQDVLTCRLCSQYMVDPRQLPCGHSFCLRCLERYYDDECRRGADRPGSRRSPSMDRRPRALLPCPAAPVCLHVAVVPDEGVAGFPVNVNMEDMKERVVREMAFNISQRIGLSPMSGGKFQSDAEESVCSDETAYSCESTASAPAGTGTADGTPRFPNLAKYAKYFEAESGTDSSGGSPRSFTPSRRTDRHRIPLSSSFQHRRRRVHGAASPAAGCDGSTEDQGRQPPSRCGSAPHLDSLNTGDGTPVYRPTVRRRQGSATASPLMRRARPTSCILEELLPDDDDDDFLKDDLHRPSETLRRAASTERSRRQPIVRERVVLPTHRENICTDDERRSVPVSSQNRHTSTDQDRRSVPTNSEASRHGTSQSDRVKPASHSTTATTPARTATRSEDNAHKTSTPKTQKRRDPAEVDGKRTTVNARPGRRVLPSIPTEPPAMSGSETWRAGGGSTGGSATAPPSRDSTSAASHHTPIQLPRTDLNDIDGPNLQCQGPSTSSQPSKSPSESRKSRPSTKDSDAKQSKTPDVGVSSDGSHRNKQEPVPETPRTSYTSRSNTTNRSSQSTSTDLPDSKPRQSRDGKRSSALPNFASNRSAEDKSTSSSPAQSKSSSASTRSSVADSSKSHQPRKKSSSTDTPVPEKSDSKKCSSGKQPPDPETPRNSGASRSNHSGKEARRVEELKSSAQSPGSAASQSPRSAHQTPAGSQGKQKGSESSEKSGGTGNKSRSSKSTGGGSGSRLTYKVNAATIHPIFMNAKKTKLNSDDASQRVSGGDTAKKNTDSMSSDDFDLYAEYTNSSPSGGRGNQATSDAGTADAPDVSVQNELNQKNSINGSTEQPSSSSTSVDHQNHTTDTSAVPHSSSSETKPCTGESESKDCSSQQQSNGTSATSNHQTTHKDGSSSDKVDAMKKDAVDEAKKAQWAEFTATLQAARTKYSTPDSHNTVIEASRPVPVYHDSVLPRWRIQRDDFAVPSSIVIVSDGSSVVADVAHCLLEFVDADGNVVHSLTGTKPFSVAVGSDDKIYVGDRRSRTVRTFDAYGSDVAQWDSETTSFGWIAGVAVLRNGQLAIIDRERCKVGIYTAGGERVTEFGSYGTRDAQLCMADFVAVDQRDRVVVADSGNHRLQLFDPAAGKLVATVAGGGRGQADGSLLWPKGVAVDGSGNIIVADSGNDRVCRYSESGQFIDNLVSGTVKPYHVTCGGVGLMGVTHFARNGTSQVDLFTLS